MRLTLKIIITLVVIALMVGVGYWLWNKFSGQLGIEQANKLSDGTTGEEKIEQLLSNNKVFDFWLDKAGNIFYVTADGLIYRISAFGSEEKLTDQSLENLTSVAASSDGSRVLISFGYPLQETFTIFDTANLGWQPLPEGLTSAAWDPKNPNRLAYLNGRGLYLMDLTNRKTKEQIRISQKDLMLQWLKPDEVYLQEKSSIKLPSSLWSLNLANNTLKTIIKKELGLTVKWSTTADLGIKLSHPEGLPSSFLINNQNRQNDAQALLLQALPHKCAFAAEAIYCAVDRLPPPAGNNLLDDYFKKRFYTSDSIYKINPVSLGYSLIYDGQNIKLDAAKLEIKNSALYFLNRFDQRLYSFEL